MAYVIAAPCVGVKDTACVDVCPVDCIHPGRGDVRFAEAPQLYIDPDICICCGACISVCPVSAIFLAEDIPVQWKEYVQINAEWHIKECASANLNRLVLVAPREIFSDYLRRS